MEKRLNKSGLRLGVGLLGLLMLFGANGSYAKPPFKNTSLYKHLVRRRSTESVKLYEKESVNSGKQEEAVEKPSDERISIDQKNKSTKEVEGIGLEKSSSGPKISPANFVAKMSPANLTDPSTFTRNMPLSEAIDILRNSTSPRLNIVVLWKDLEENADIYPETPIGIDGVTGVSLSRHLKSLIEGVSGGSPEGLGYVVDDGVVVISTLGSLPERMVTRVYDISDLVGQPAQYGGIQGMMMSRMVGMMSGMGGGMGGGMMGGMGGGMMGGMGGGMMGGMGGMMGGMGGMMGGMGGMMGGGMGGFGRRY